MKKLNINGYARHGKDTVAEMLRDYHGYRLVPASERFADILMTKLPLGWYETTNECFKDRLNHRRGWFNAIRDYCKNDPARFVKLTLEGGDIYVGHRARSEFEHSKELFDLTVWVDSTGRGLVKEETCELLPEDHDYIIYNNGDLHDLKREVARLQSYILGLK